MGRVVVGAVALEIGHGSGNQTKLTLGRIMRSEIMTPKSSEIMGVFLLLIGEDDACMLLMREIPGLGRGGVRMRVCCG